MAKRSHSLLSASVFLVGLVCVIGGIVVPVVLFIQGTREDRASGVIPEVKANRIMLKNIAVTGLHWPAYHEHEPEKMAEAFRGCAELYRTGRIRPLIRTRVPLEGVGEALEALDDRRTVGKLIVEP